MIRAIPTTLIAMLLAALVPLQGLGAEIVGGDAFEADADASISGRRHAMLS